MKKLFLSLVILSITASQANALTISDAKNLMDEGRFRLAVSAFDEVLKQNPNNADAYYYRSFCHLSLKEYKDAVNDCMKAIIYHPEIYEAIGVETLIDDAVDIYPRDRENAIYLINSAIDFRHESKREDLFISINEKILSALDKSISEKKIRETEDYLEFLTVYPTKKTKTDKSRIEIRQQLIKKLKHDRKKSMKLMTPINIEKHPSIAYSITIKDIVEKNCMPHKKLIGVDPNLKTVIAFEVFTTGEIKNLRIEKSSGNPYLDEVQNS